MRKPPGAEPLTPLVRRRLAGNRRQGPRLMSFTTRNTAPRLQRAAAFRCAGAACGVETCDGSGDRQYRFRHIVRANDRPRQRRALPVDIVTGLTSLAAFSAAARRCAL